MQINNDIPVSSKGIKKFNKNSSSSSEQVNETKSNSPVNPSYYRAYNNITFKGRNYNGTKIREDIKRRGVESRATYNVDGQKFSLKTYKTKHSEYVIGENNKLYKLKYTDDDSRISEQIVASKIYNSLGVKAPEYIRFEKDGKKGYMAEVFEDKFENPAASRKSLHQSFVADVILGNRNGLSNGNTMIDKNGTPVKLSVSGSLNHRSTGGLKDQKLSDIPTEFETMRNPSINNDSATALEDMSDEELYNAIQSVANRYHQDKIKSIVSEQDNIDPNLDKTLNSRLENLLKFDPPIPDKDDVLNSRGFGKNYNPDSYPNIFAYDPRWDDECITQINDKQWQRVLDRGYLQSQPNQKKLTMRSIMYLSQLTDEEHNTAIQRGLYKPIDFGSKPDLIDGFEIATFARMNNEDWNKVVDRNLLTLQRDHKGIKGLLTSDFVQDVIDLSDDDWYATVKTNILETGCSSRDVKKFAKLRNSDDVKEFYPPFDVRVKQLSSIELGTSYYSKNLSATDILEFAMVDNEQYSRIPELTNNFTEYSRAIDLAKLSANDYQVLKKRGLTTNITNPYGLSKIAEISDEAWNNLDKRGIKELCPDNYIDWACLGELSDDEFQIAKDKNLFDNRGTESNPLYLSGEEIAKLVTTLDDNDWDNFEKRGLFKDYKRVFSGFKDGLAQYNDLLILAKMPDSEFEKFDYLQRNVPMNLFTSTSIELVKLNDKEFQRLFDRDLFQYLNRFESYDNYSEDAPILTTLSKLEDKDYETFKEKYLYNPMETIQSKVMALTLDKMKISDKEDISELSFKQKRQYLDVLLQKSGVLLTKDFMKHYKSSSILPKNIDEYIDLMSKLVESVGASSKPLDEVTKTEFFNSLNELSAQGSEFRNLDLAQDGFKLEMSYPRDKFISDVSNTISDLNMNEKLKVFDYYGFELQNKQNGEVHLSGYPHSYQSEEKLAKIKDPKTREVISQLEPMIKDFTDNNKILPDGKFVSGSMAKTLNGVFKALPELYTTVGKVQHGVHDYTIDIHSLSVLQKCMNISDFDNFSDKDKRIIMISALLHDITKEEHEIDKSHPANSSFDSYYILEKFNLPKEEQMSIYQLIKNHDMLEHCNGTVYDTKLKDYRHINDAEQDKIVQNYAYELHTGNLAKLETVFTKADLLSVKKDGSFYNKFADACDVVSSKLEKSIHKIKASSIFLPQTKIPTADKIKTDGKNSFDMLTYDIDGNPIHNKLIKLSKGLDLHQYGFDEGVNADNFNVLIHGFDTKEQQTILDALDLVDQKALLSASYVVYNKGNYHAFRQQGFIKNIPDDSIGAMYFRDFGSGCKKDTDKLVNDYINGGQSSYRNYLPKLVKSKLNLTDDEYIKLYEEIKDKPMDVIEKERPEVAKAFNQIFEEMETKKRSFGRDYNEGLVTKGIPTAVYYEGLAKNSSSDNNQEYPFEDIPEFLRKYAEENNIPIIYFGK